MTYAEHLARVREAVLRDGWTMLSVGRERTRPPWSHTVGLTEMGLPELVVTGLSEDDAAELLVSVGSHAIHDEAPEPGERIPLRGLPEIEIVEVVDPSAQLITAVDLYGPRVRALQLVHADDRGHWPWEPGFRGARGGQPVLGVRARA
jgi:hypothetical protein